MDDLERYIEKRKNRSPVFSQGFGEGFEYFKIGIMLRHAREEAGMTQEQIAKILRTKKSAISRIENHAEDIRFSTIYKYAEALGKKLQLSMS